MREEKPKKLVLAPCQRQERAGRVSNLVPCGVHAHTGQGHRATIRQRTMTPQQYVQPNLSLSHIVGRQEEVVDLRAPIDLPEMNRCQHRNQGRLRRVLAPDCFLNALPLPQGKRARRTGKVEKDDVGNLSIKGLLQQALWKLITIESQTNDAIAGLSKKPGQGSRRAFLFSLPIQNQDVSHSPAVSSKNRKPSASTRIG